jgi:hypothetical protein
MHSLTLIATAAALFCATHAKPIPNETHSSFTPFAPEAFVPLEAFNSTLDSTGPRIGVPLYVVGGLVYPPYVLPEVSKCGDSTFGDTTNGASAVIEDCEELLGAIGQTTNWVLQENQWGVLVQRGTCAFAAQVLNGREDFRWRGKWKGFTCESSDVAVMDLLVVLLVHCSLRNLRKTLLLTNGDVHRGRWTGRVRGRPRFHCAVCEGWPRLGYGHYAVRVYLCSSRRSSGQMGAHGLLKRRYIWTSSSCKLETRCVD